MHHGEFRRKRNAIGTQKQVAAKLGISDKTVWRMEKGESHIKPPIGNEEESLIEAMPTRSRIRISEAKHRELANELALALRLVRNINSVCEASLNVDPARPCAQNALSHLKALQHHLQRDYLKSSRARNNPYLYFMPRAAKARIIFE